MHEYVEKATAPTGLRFEKLLHECFASRGYSTNLTTANAIQVLLSARGGHLVYLEIGDQVLIKEKNVQLEYDISCLGINPID